MIIENVEALKTWLIASLKPICDADPASLAKYVVALVKKDKPEKDLRDVCSDQLDVFLQTKTKGFVDSLFECLNKKSYLNASNEAVKSVPEEPKTSEPETVKTEPVKKEEAIPDIKKQRGPAEKPKDVKRDERRRTSRSLSPRERRRDYDDRRKRFEDRRISDERRPYRRRSRSRSYSPRRSPRRLRRSRSPRGRSRSWSRSRSRSKPRSWSRSRSRSWSRSRSRSRDRKGKRPLPDSRGSTPTLDNGKYGISTIGHIPTVGAGVYSTAQGDGRFTIETQAQGKPQPSARQRCKDYDEKGFCLRGDLCQFDHGLDPVVVEDVSIPPPYIPGGPPPPNGGPRMPGPGPGPGGPGPGPGFMPHRGPPPPHQMIPRHPPPRNDHFEAYNPEAPAMTHPPPPSFWHGPPPPNGPPPPPRGGPPNQPPFLPQQQQQLPMQMRQRDHLVTIPVKQEEPPIVPPGTEASVSPDNEVQAKKPESRAPEGKSERTVIAPKRPYDNVPYHRNDNNVGPPPAKKPFDYNRIGGYRKPNFDNTITQLEVRKIPKQFNNITSINEHFSKFGTLTNIQVNFEGDAEAALVSFATNDQALACYRSSEPLFNNRFVKVFWHKDKENDQSNPEKPTEDHRSVKARLGPPVIPHPSKMTYNNVEKKPAENPSQDNKEKTILYTSSVGSITKTVYNPEAIKARKTLTSPTAVSSAGFVSKIEEIKRREEQKKDALKKKQEIENKKHELLQKQLNQQKMLIEKLEKNKNMSTEDKNKIKETLKILTSSLEKINTGMAPKKAVASKIANPEQARKEILDTELELFNKQHTGEDTSDLKKKLSELTKQATAMGLLGRGRGRGKVVKGAATKWVAEGLAGRGRGSTASYHQPGGSRVLDNRPKQLEVSGYSEEEKDQLLPHFSSFGQVEKVDQSEDENSAIVTFKTRRDAEKAMFRAAKFHGKTLSLKWHMEVKVKINLNISSDDSFTADAEEVEDSEVGGGEDELDEEALLAGDDEEEEDEESRSWRR